MIDKKWSEIGGGRSMQFSVNGVSFIGITEETGIDKINLFERVCRTRQSEIAELVSQVEKDREWNMNNPGKGKLWPSMRQLERLLAELCKQCGIVDS